MFIVERLIFWSVRGDFPNKTTIIGFRDGKRSPELLPCQVIWAFVSASIDAVPCSYSSLFWNTDPCLCWKTPINRFASCASSSCVCKVKHGPASVLVSRYSSTIWPRVYELCSVQMQVYNSPYWWILWEVSNPPKNVFVRQNDWHG